jgi:ankyrin repeat protein
MGGSLLTLKWLLEKGGARITERKRDGESALLLAAAYGRLSTCQWLLEHGGADIAEASNDGTGVWNMLVHYLSNTAEVTALLRVMVLKGAPPAEMVAKLCPKHARVVVEGARLRAALPAYFARRWALLDAHCPLISPLRNMI